LILLFSGVLLPHVEIQSKDVISGTSTAMQSSLFLFSFFLYFVTILFFLAILPGTWVILSWKKTLGNAMRTTERSALFMLVIQHEMN
jgi:hypothetical protein